MRIKCDKIAHVVTNRKICETFKSNDNFDIRCCSPEPCVVLANSVYQIQCKNISTGVLLEKKNPFNTIENGLFSGSICKSPLKIVFRYHMKQLTV